VGYTSEETSAIRGPDGLWAAILRGPIATTSSQAEELVTSSQQGRIRWDVQVGLRYSRDVGPFLVDIQVLRI